MYRVERYDSERFSQWNDFIANSKNGTFLLNRGFMEYHNDRFDDFSLMVFEKDILIAVLPAHSIANEVYSHLGLTYGGLVYTKKTKLSMVIRALQSVLAYLHANAVAKLHIKLIPAIYHKYPSDEFSYALFVAGARLTRKDSLCVIEQANKLPVTGTRRHAIRKGIKNELVIKEEPEFNLFWNEILIPNMNKKHGVKPVHSAEEIIMLHKRFPDNIRHFNVYHNDTIVAGTTVFITDTVAHPQHISGNKDKNTLGSLDFLYHHLITEVFAGKKYFDFGISNEEQGQKLNESLIFWKESFGARTLVQDFYEVATANFSKLDNVLI
jgi:hypothetical protein